MSEMSLYEQVRCIEEMQEFLLTFCVDLRGEMNGFQDRIKELRQEGLSVEVEKSYQSRYYAPANEIVEGVIDDIKYKHYAYLEDVKNHLKAALSHC